MRTRRGAGERNRGKKAQHENETLPFIFFFLVLLLLFRFITHIQQNGSSVRRHREARNPHVKVASQMNRNGSKRQLQNADINLKLNGTRVFTSLEFLCREIYQNSLIRWNSGAASARRSVIKNKRDLNKKYIEGFVV